MHVWYCLVEYFILRKNLLVLLVDHGSSLLLVMSLNFELHVRLDELAMLDTYLTCANSILLLSIFLCAGTYRFAKSYHDLH